MGDSVDLCLLYDSLFANKDVVGFYIGVALLVGAEGSAAHKGGVVADVETLQKGDFLLGGVGPQATEGLFQYPPCAEDVVVGRQGVVPTPYEVRERARRGLPHIILHGGDVAVDGCHRTGARGIADFEVHLRGEIHLPGNFGDAAAAKTCFREILVALQPHPAPHIEVDGMIFDIDMVGRCLVAAHVDGVLLVVPIDCLLELLLGHRVILFRHSYVPQDIFIIFLWAQCVVGQLGVVVIRPNGDELELLGIAVIIHLKIVGTIGLVAQTGQFRSLLERHTLHLVGQLVIVGVKIEGVVLEIPDCKGIALFVFRLFLAHRAYDADAPGIDVGKGFGLVVVPHAVLLDIHIDVLHATRQLQAGVSIRFGINVAAAAHRIEPGVELGIVGHIAAQR